VTDRTTIDELLAAARARLDRLSAREAYDAMRAGPVLVDIRSQDQRRADGVVPGALWSRATSWSGASTRRARTAIRRSATPRACSC
jgi:hypothetical protein